MPHWVLHCDAQLLHGGPVLGSPCEDRTSMAKTATKAAALRAAAPKAIAALDGCSRVAAIAREKDICREREDNTTMSYTKRSKVSVYDRAVGDAIYRLPMQGR